LLCIIGGATVENTLFEDYDATNTFQAFNQTRAFLHFKKLLLTRYGARANMLVIILLNNDYFLQYFI